MKVWVAERGCYSDRGIAGVYSTAEIAMKHLARPNEKWERSEYIYRDITYVEWNNGLDWDDYIRIVETKVIDG